MERAHATVALTAAMLLVAACSGGNKRADVTTGLEHPSITPRASAIGSTGADSSTAVPTTAPDAATPGNGTVDGVVEGGDPSSPPVVVATVPPVTPRPGTTPVIDSTDIAPPGGVEALSIIVDMDATRPGIQAARDVHSGDTFRVAIVAAAIPPSRGGLTGLNFNLNYDKTKIVAPTIAGGPTTDRNPRLNAAALGGADPQWNCLPAAEGDLDDPGGTDGDGNPSTGQAFLSCYAPGTGLAGGTQVIATVEFTAIAEGSSELKLSEVALADALGVEFAHCEGDAAVAPFVPCPSGTANVTR